MIILRQKTYSPGKVAEVVSKNKHLREALGHPRKMEELGIQKLTAKIKSGFGKGLAEAKNMIK